MENKNESYSKGTILIIFILFMFSSKLLNFAFSIGKSIFYILLIFYFLNIFNPIIAKKIKEMIFDLLNFSDNNIIKNILSIISSFIMNLIKKDEPILKKDIYKKKKNITKKKNN